MASHVEVKDAGTKPAKRDWGVLSRRKKFESLKLGILSQGRLTAILTTSKSQGPHTN